MRVSAMLRMDVWTAGEVTGKAVVADRGGACRTETDAERCPCLAAREQPACGASRSGRESHDGHGQSRTTATRSAGVSVLSTTSSASPIESASSNSCSGSVLESGLTIGSSSRGSESRGTLGRKRRACGTFRHSRETTVASQLPRCSTALVSVRRGDAPPTALPASRPRPCHIPSPRPVT
jgi:hypothetical protein